jgi:hypothetical protein
MKPEVTRCPKCGRKKRRSNPANARYWLLLHLIADKVKPEGFSYTPETWHEWAKQRFLGADEVKLPNGKTYLKSHSSADLSTSEFADYMTKLETWAIERDVWLDSLEA